MEINPPMPGSDDRKFKRLTVNLDPDTFDAIDDVMNFYEERRKIQGDARSTYKWTASRLTYSWIKAVLAQLSEQTGVDLLNAEARRAHIAKALEKARQEAAQKKKKR